MFQYSSEKISPARPARPITPPAISPRSRLSFSSTRWTFGSSGRKPSEPAYTWVNSQNSTDWNPITTIAEAATSVSTSKVTLPMLNGCGTTIAPMARPAMSSTRPGRKNSQRGLNSSRNRRWRQPSRQERRCGGLLRPSLARVVGTSVTRWPARVAFTTISLANSIPVACRLSAITLSRLNPRRPQWKSPILLRKNSRPMKLSTGLPRYLCSGGIAPGAMPPRNRLPITRSAPLRSSSTNGIRLVKS